VAGTASRFGGIKTSILLYAFSTEWALILIQSFLPLQTNFDCKIIHLFIRSFSLVESSCEVSFSLEGSRFWKNWILLDFEMFDKSLDEFLSFFCYLLLFNRKMFISIFQSIVNELLIVLRMSNVCARSWIFVRWLFGFKYFLHTDTMFGILHSN